MKKGTRLTVKNYIIRKKINEKGSTKFVPDLSFVFNGIWICISSRVRNQARIKLEDRILIRDFSNADSKNSHFPCSS